jgi:hypothetical protein
MGFPKSKFYAKVADIERSPRMDRVLTTEKTKAAYSGPPFGASFSLLASRAHIPVNSVLVIYPR